jgi:hypothetical protein
MINLKSLLSACLPRFRMRRVSMLFAAATMSLAACGGSSDSPTGTSGGTAAIFSATVGGVAWTAALPVYLITPTGVNITGPNAANTMTVTLTVLASAPGTYSLNFGQSTPSGLGTVNKTGGQAYSTVAPGGTGSVTLTTLTAHRAVGTFAFDAIGSGPTDILHVTNGKFDITF